MSEIVLVTRLRTLNKGNQALSVAWVDMTRRAFPDAPIRVLERRPRHLLQYTLRQLASERDPVGAFDRIAEQLARTAPGASFRLSPPATTKIVLDEQIQPAMRFVALRQRLNLRGQLARLGRYSAEYQARLAAYQRAQLVILNPAGEFYPREPAAAFYHLLDAHVAQKLGRPVAIMNHTMDITDPTLRKIIPAVYRTLSLVGFRDDKSVHAFQAMGGDPKNVLVTPDLALTCSVLPAQAHRAKTVGVAINVPEATAGKYLDGWRRAIRELQTAGFTVVLVSNEVPADQPFYDELAQAFDVRVEGAGLDHDRYGALLGSFDVVVTSRMHTGVLAMIGGAPVVPIEGSSFKITGLFQELGVPGAPVILPRGAAWPEQVAKATVAASTHREQVVREMSGRIAGVRDRIVADLVPRLRGAAA